MYQDTTGSNQFDDTNMGYCLDPSNKFNVNGWYGAYAKDGTTYLTSEGSSECMCTNEGKCDSISTWNWLMLTFNPSQ